MECVRIIDTNAANINQYSICGYKNSKNAGYKSKIEWLKKQYPLGLKYKILYSDKDGSIGSIEYIPGEYAWRPVEAKGYMFIHCIMIMPKEYKTKGYGSLMVDECMKDVELQGMNGVAVVTRKGSWMAGREVFIGKGFEVADTLKPDFELLVKKIKPATDSPKFSLSAGKVADEYKTGLQIFTSGQCPYTDKAVAEIIESAKSDYGIDARIVEMISSADTAKCPSAFGTFTIAFNGEVVADHPISKNRFRNIMNKVII